MSLAGKVPCFTPRMVVRVWYVNWKGERALRTITPISIRFDSTEWHAEPQWLLRCFDHDKQAEREFALSGIEGWPKIEEKGSHIPVIFGL